MTDSTQGLVFASSEIGFNWVNGPTIHNVHILAAFLHSHTSAFCSQTLQTGAAQSSQIFLFQMIVFQPRCPQPLEENWHSLFSFKTQFMLCSFNFETWHNSPKSKLYSQSWVFKISSTKSLSIIKSSTWSKSLMSWATTFISL